MSTKWIISHISLRPQNRTATYCCGKSHPQTASCSFKKAELQRRITICLFDLFMFFKQGKKYGYICIRSLSSIVLFRHWKIRIIYVVCQITLMFQVDFRRDSFVHLSCSRFVRLSPGHFCTETSEKKKETFMLSRLTV